jgi:hypothetical protein
VTRAAVEPVEPDDARAGDFLAQAQRFLAGAEAAPNLESAVVLYWNACISAMDAVLAAGGFRIGSGEDAHAVRIDAAFHALGGGFGDLRERLDEWRRERHSVSYRAITPAAAEVAAIQTDVRDIVAAAEDHLDRRSRSGDS